MKNKSRTAPRRSLSIEQLESRLPLAGDVVVKVSGQNLTITGDAQANDIAITSAPGHIVVTGNAGTTITFEGTTAGAANVPVPGAQFGKVGIKMGLAGNNAADKVSIADLFTAGNLSVEGKGGGDVSLDGLHIEGTTKIAFKNGLRSPGNGSRILINNSSLVKNAAISTGKDNDEVVVTDAIFNQNFTVAAGAGNNTVGILGTRSDTVGNFNSSTKIDGNFTYGSKDIGVDNVGFLGVVVGGNLTAKTGKGGDDFVGAADLVVKGKTSVTTGTGNDVVAIGLQDQGGNSLPPGGFGNVLLGNVTVSTKAGNDSVTAHETIFGTAGVKTQGRVTISLGDGNDRLTEDANTFNIPAGLYTAAGAETAILKSRGGKGTDSLLSSLSPVGDFFLKYLQFENENVDVPDLLDDIFARVEPAFGDILLAYGIDITP